MGGGAGNPLLTALGVDPSLGNMEGKELRFGTGAGCPVRRRDDRDRHGDGQCDLQLDDADRRPVQLFNLLIGEIIPGGVGTGLYGILLFAIIAVFIAGLMVGRTPEYLGKKIEAREMKLVMLRDPRHCRCSSSDSRAVCGDRQDSRSAASATAVRTASAEILYALCRHGVRQRLARSAASTADTPWCATRRPASRCWPAVSSMGVPIMALAGGLAARRAPRLRPEHFRRTVRCSSAC